MANVLDELLESAREPSSDEFPEDENGWARRQFRPKRNFRKITEAQIRDAGRKMALEFKRRRPK